MNDFRVPEELRTEVYNTVQEAVTKTTPKKKKCKKVKWLSEEVLQIAERSERQRRKAFHAQMGTIKDRNDMDLTEAEDIKKRWREYTEELYKKDLHDPDNRDGVITRLEPDTWNVKSSGPQEASL